MAGRACRMSPMAPKRTTSNRYLDWVCKHLIFSQGEVFCSAAEQCCELRHEPVQGGVFEGYLQPGCEQGRGGGIPESVQAHMVLFGGEESDGAGGPGGGLELGHVGGGIAVMIAENALAGQAYIGSFKAGKELSGAGYAAKGEDGAVEGGDFHTAT